ncbi:MAG: radical SAM protein [Candidatus Baldrarchaeia archaeon]
MRVLRKFDPWKNPLCTCPPKYSLNPYTGCAHKCVYCYTTSYIPNAYKCRPKRGFIAQLKADIVKARRDFHVSMSNSSDPYPPIEKSHNLTRRALQVLKAYGMKVLILTKSDLVTRDVDILSRMKSVVSITITGMEGFVRVLEPYAPSPESRLKAMKFLHDHGIPTVLRLDPIIPYVNDDERILREVIEGAAGAGVKHVVSSTLKLKPDIFNRFRIKLDIVANRFRDLYFRDGQKIGGSYYLPREMRYNILKMVKDVCEEFGLTFAVCREGFRDLNTAPSCDGSHLFHADDNHW